MSHGISEAYKGMARLFLFCLVILSSLHQTHAQATGADCNSGSDTCTDSNASCTGSAGTGGSETCECNANHVDISGTCLVAATQTCTSGGTGCVTHASCTDPNSDMTFECNCDSGYTQATTFCEADLGTACTVPSDCRDANAACTGSVCVCASTYYDDDGPSTAGGTCTPGLDLNADCSGPTVAVRDAACQAKNTETTCVTSGGSTLCTCNSGYSDDDGVGTPGGSCVADLGTACTVASDCGDANAACTGSVCVCASTYYDDDGPSTAGGTCTPGLDLNADCTAPATAVRDAACQAKNTETTCVTSGGNTLCTCNSGYYDDDGVGTAGGSCVAVLTTSCTDETNCGDLDENAECTGTVGSKTCNCKSGYTGASGDVCQVQSAGEHNTASFWLCSGLLLLAAKRVLL